MSIGLLSVNLIKTIHTKKGNTISYNQNVKRRYFV